MLDSRLFCNPKPKTDWVRVLLLTLLTFSLGWVYGLYQRISDQEKTIDYFLNEKRLIKIVNNNSDIFLKELDNVYDAITEQYGLIVEMNKPVLVKDETK